MRSCHDVTRHNSRADLIEALNARKHVFGEKPLALTLEELPEVQAAYESSCHLMVGFNQLFTLVRTMKRLLTASPNLNHL